MNHWVILGQDSLNPIHHLFGLTEIYKHNYIAMENGTFPYLSNIVFSTTTRNIWDFHGFSIVFFVDRWEIRPHLRWIGTSLVPTGQGLLDGYFTWASLMGRLGFFSGAGGKGPTTEGGNVGCRCCFVVVFEVVHLKKYNNNVINKLGFQWVSIELIWVVVSNIFYFHPYLGKIPILTNIFSKGLKPPTSYPI